MDQHGTQFQSVALHELDPHGSEKIPSGQTFLIEESAYSRLQMGVMRGQASDKKEVFCSITPQDHKQLQRGRSRRVGGAAKIHQDTGETHLRLHKLN